MLKKEGKNVVKNENVENYNDENVKLLSDNIDALKDNLILTNFYATAYEKSHLDMYLGFLSNFDKVDVDKINDILRKVNYIFTNVGINLTKDNFNYNFCVNDFMKLYFKNKEFKQNELNKFYKNCPNIFKYVSLNYKYLYCQNEGVFNIYYDNLFTLDIDKTYKLLCIKKDNFLRENLNKKISAKDYKNALLFIDESVSLEKVLDIYHFLIEYKYFNLLKFITKEFQDILKNKNNKYPKIKNKINKKEKILFKKNQKLDKYLKGNNNEKINKLKNGICSITDYLAKLYDAFEIKTIKQKIYNLTNDDTYENIFILALSNYNFLVFLFKKNNLNYDEYYSDLFNLVYFPYKKIIRNKWVSDEKLLISNILNEYNLNENILNDIDKNICNLKLVIEYKSQKIKQKIDD